MYAAALDGKAPSILRYERFGVPYLCVVLSAAIGMLSYVSYEMMRNHYQLLQYANYASVDECLELERRCLFLVLQHQRCIYFTCLDQVSPVSNPRKRLEY